MFEALATPAAVCGEGGCQEPKAAEGAPYCVAHHEWYDAQAHWGQRLFQLWLACGAVSGICWACFGLFTWLVIPPVVVAVAALVWAIVRLDRMYRRLPNLRRR